MPSARNIGRLSRPGSLPGWLDWYTTYGLVGLGVGTIFCLAALFTPLLRVGNAPSYTFLCWLYCASYDPLWSNLAYAVASLGVLASGLALWRRDRATVFLATFGVLALPLGLPALLEAYRRHGHEEGAS